MKRRLHISGNEESQFFDDMDRSLGGGRFATNRSHESVVPRNRQATGEKHEIGHTVKFNKENPHTKALESAKVSQRKSWKGVGYEARDSISHRKYDFGRAIRRMEKTGKVEHRNDGKGHEAGFRWAQSKKIHWSDPATKYSKNSPSFDEGVHQWKLHSRSAHEKALAHKKK